MKTYTFRDPAVERLHCSPDMKIPDLEEPHIKKTEERKKDMGKSAGISEFVSFGLHGRQSRDSFHICQAEVASGDSGSDSTYAFGKAE